MRKECRFDRFPFYAIISGKWASLSGEEKLLLVSCVRNEERMEELEKQIEQAFEEAIFLSRLAEKVGKEVPEVWKVVLQLVAKGKLDYFSWQGKTVIVKRRP